MLGLPKDFFLYCERSERSFSQMKLRLRNRISDSNLPRLMRIAIEGPELSQVNFNEVLDIFKEQKHRIVVYSILFSCC